MVATESRMRAWTLAVLSIALCATRLATASASNVALSEEKIQMSNAGNLRYESLSDDEKLLLFQQYVTDCQRVYSSVTEEREKYDAFKRSLVAIDALNAQERAVNGTAVFGVNIFSDLSFEEFKANSLGTKLPDNYASNRRLMQVAPAAAHTTATEADWRGIYTTPVKDQGACGSCWAFSAVAQIESDAILAGFATTSTILSTQQMTRCTYDYNGCLGGFPLTGYEYVAKAGGLTTEALYPYNVMSSYCDKTKTNYAVTVTMSYRVEGEQAMINQVLAGRTLSVAVDAHQWGPYKSGIFSGCSVNYRANHAVNIVGVNVEEGYWIVRNSWGSWWGDDGYIKVAMGSNMCGINNYATYADAAPVESTDTTPSDIDPTGYPSPAPEPNAESVTPPTPEPSAEPVTPPTPEPSAEPVTPPTSEPSDDPVTPEPSADPVTPEPSAEPVTPPTPEPSARPITPPTPGRRSKPVTPPTPGPGSKTVPKPSALPSARATSIPTKVSIPPAKYLTRRPSRSRSPSRSKGNLQKKSV